MEISAADEVQQITIHRPHVVILGAGASRAAMPDGDRFGQKLPLMHDFTNIVPVTNILRQSGIQYQNRNFEDIYTELVNDSTTSTLREQLENKIYSYFEALRLPDEPTIYDHLILSLRSKDVIATFNWDPFLIQAARRNHILKDRLPLILFLHGNVMAGYCAIDQVHGVKGCICSRCGRPFSASKLLYPIAEKNYHLDPMIADSWTALEKALRSAFMVSIFGYRAPTSDQSAMDLLKKAWGRWEERELEQIEIIDKREENDLLDAWSDFIHTHHYEVYKDFYESWIVNHPRRTGEAWWNQYMESLYIEDNPLPSDTPFPLLWQWFKSLLDAENYAKTMNDKGL